MVVSAAAEIHRAGTWARTNMGRSAFATSTAVIVFTHHGMLTLAGGSGCPANVKSSRHCMTDHISQQDTTLQNEIVISAALLTIYLCRGYTC